MCINRLSVEERHVIYKKLENENYEKEFCTFKIDPCYNDWVKVLKDLNCMDSTAEYLDDDFYQNFISSEIKDLAGTYTSERFKEPDDVLLNKFLELAEYVYVELNTSIDGNIFVYITSNSKNVKELKGIDNWGEVTNPDMLKESIIKLYQEKVKELQNTPKKSLFEYTVKPVLMNGVKKFWIEVDKELLEKIEPRANLAFNNTSSSDYSPVIFLFENIHEAPELYNHKEIIQKLKTLSALREDIRGNRTVEEKDVYVFFGGKKTLLHIKERSVDGRVLIRANNPENLWEYKKLPLIKEIIKESFELFLLMEKRIELIEESCQDETVEIK